MVDKPKTKPTSLFIDLQGQLAEVISGIETGKKLPSEPVLARMLGVSRATLREAMRSFEGQGVIRRRQGVGTFVVSHTHTLDGGLEVLESIETLAKKINLQVRMGELEIQRLQADNPYSQLLDVASGKPLVKISRVIHTTERPVAYLVDILPEEVLKESDIDEGFTGSVLDLLLRRGDPLLTNSLTEISAIAATPEVARSLEIQRGDVLLYFVARLYAADGRVVDYSMSYFLPGYFRFKIVRRVGGSSSL